MLRPTLVAPVFILCLALSRASVAGPIVLDFEAFTDGDALTTQIPGLTFSNTGILTAGVTLNEFEFPPASGLNVAADLGGDIRIDFASDVLAFGAFFTYLTPLTLQAFDAADNPLGAVSTAFGSNLALSGDAGSAPNEFLGLAAANIAYVIISGGDPAGDSFTVDDVTITVPEPGTLGLLFWAGAGFYAYRRRTTRTRKADPHQSS